MSDRAFPLELARAIPVWIMTLVTCPVEALIACWWLNGQIGAGFAIAIHFLVLLSIAVQVFILMRKGKDLRIGLLLLCLTLALGPAGGVAAFFVAAMTSVFSRSARPFEEWYRAIFPDQVPSNFDILEKTGQDRPHLENSIMPLIDVLTFGTHAQKQALLTLLTTNFKPQFAPVLKTALNDTNNAIRVQAATAITKIDNEFTAHAVDLTRRSEKDPEDLELLRAVACHYDQFAYTGLLEHDRETECRDNALRYYRRYLLLRPSDGAARIAAGRILVREGRYDEAVEWFEQAGFEESSPEQGSWYLESLFRTGRFEKLRSILMGREQLLQRRADLPLEILEAAKLWLARSAGENA